MSLKLNERYPGRFNNPSAGYPGGSFKNRTTPTAKDGSYLEKDWANDKEGFFQSLLSAAEIAADGSVDAVGASQYYNALLAVITSKNTDLLNTTRIDVASAATVNLTSLAPSTRHINITGSVNILAITVTAGQCYFVRFAGSLILTSGSNVVTQTGQNIITRAGDTCIIRSIAANQVEVLCYTPSLNTKAVSGSAKNLKISTNGTTGVAAITADEILVSSAAGDAITLRNVAVNPSLAASGKNGLDSSTAALSSWYFDWVIYNPDTLEIAGLFSLSATSPTMPAGFTHKALVGFERTPASGSAFPQGRIQYDRRWQWKIAPGTNLTATPTASSGVVGSPSAGTYVAVSLAAFVPSISSRVSFTGLSAGASQAVAPSANYGPSNGNTNAPPFCSSAGSTNNNIAQGELALEVMSLYIAADGASCRVYITGGEINL